MAGPVLRGSKEMPGDYHKVQSSGKECSRMLTSHKFFY